MVNLIYENIVLITIEKSKVNDYCNTNNYMVSHHIDNDWFLFKHD